MAGDPYKTWHALFDDICLERGHVDNLKLASDLCDLGKSTAAGAFDSALKSLSHWRQGKHTPARRNFRLLTRILEIDDQSGWADDWFSLYEQAVRRKPANDIDASLELVTNLDDAREPVEKRVHRSLKHYAAVAAMIALVSVGVFSLSEHTAVGGSNTKRVTTLPVDMTDQQIFYRELANLKVGQSLVVHGKRGPACGEQPPEWQDVLKFLPELSTGVWSDGGVGFRVSRSCGGATPARAVVFTATRIGMDKFMLYNDQITITVK